MALSSIRAIRRHIYRQNGWAWPVKGKKKDKASWLRRPVKDTAPINWKALFRTRYAPVTDSRRRRKAAAARFGVRSIWRD